MEKAIIVKNVSKKYKLYHSTKERMLDLVSPRDYGEDFYALANVDFVANKGEAIGFIGINGSGKSTLSNIIAGIVPETTGTVTVNGQASLIAVAAGLKNDLSGRDNIELKCLMLGFTKEEIEALEPAIIEFAELEKFIDQPVKSYSSGMKSRLGFAISVNVDPDILLIDEALSVGDKAFAKKSLDKMKEFKEEEKTMIFVSHSIGQMKQFCDKILWIEFGMVREYGLVGDVIPKYEAFLNEWQKMSKKDREDYRNKVMAYQEKRMTSDEGEKVESPWNSVDQYVHTEEYFTENLTSRLARVDKDNAYILTAPNDNVDRMLANDYADHTYYVKRRAEYRGEKYYLLSSEPSAVNGKIGWMKVSDLFSYAYVEVDEDPKVLYLTGSGIAYNRPWGSDEDHIFSSLEEFAGAVFNIDKTVLVRRGTWYRGELNGEKVWIYKKHLQETAL